jgi:hypothetical protein
MKSVELGKKIAPSADIPDQIVRKARLNFGEKIEASFTAAGLPMPKGLGKRIVLFSRSKGYRLGVGATVR